jgi:hypothetical protein
MCIYILYIYNLMDSRLDTLTDFLIQRIEAVGF